MYCPNCYRPYRPNDRFCPVCGTNLTLQPDEPVTRWNRPTRKGTHWIPILILVLLSVFGTLVFFATAGLSPEPEAPAVQSDTPWFSVRNGDLYFDESLYTGGSELTVPEEINGETVLYLSDGCFASCDGLTTVHLPDTLEWIGTDAFLDCTALRGLYIPDSVWYIGGSAFDGCIALEAISISRTMEEIEPDAFRDCPKLRFIFFSGTTEEWHNLYRSFINSDTTVYCEDGTISPGSNSF